MATIERHWHYFCQSHLGSSKHEDIFHCILHRLEADVASGQQAVGCYLWKVPCTISTEYEVVDGRPQVEGAEWMDTIVYDPTRQPDNA